MKPRKERGIIKGKLRLQTTQIIAIVFALIFYFVMPFALEIRQTLVILAFAPIGASVPGFTGEMGGDVGLSSAFNSVCMCISIVVIVSLLLIML